MAMGPTSNPLIGCALVNGSKHFFRGFDVDPILVPILVVKVVLYEQQNQPKKKKLTNKLEASKFRTIIYLLVYVSRL